MTDVQFQIETGSGAQGTSVRIRDAKSGVAIAVFQLTPAQAFDFLRGGTMRIDGQTAERLDRIGKTMLNESVYVPDSVFGDLPYGDRVAAGEGWAQAKHPGWDTYEARRTNTGGVHVVLRKWVAA